MTLKKLIASAFLLLCFALTGYSQDTTQTNKHKPKAVYKVGSAKVTVWENNGKNGTWKNFKVEKMYMKDEQWKSSSSFDEKELLELKEAIEKAIVEEKVKVKTPEEK